MSIVKRCDDLVTRHRREVPNQVLHLPGEVLWVFHTVVSEDSQSIPGQHLGGASQG